MGVDVVLADARGARAPTADDPAMSTKNDDPSPPNTAIPAMATSNRGAVASADADPLRRAPIRRQTWVR